MKHVLSILTLWCSFTLAQDEIIRQKNFIELNKKLLSEKVQEKTPNQGVLNINNVKSFSSQNQYLNNAEKYHPSVYQHYIDLLYKQFQFRPQDYGNYNFGQKSVDIRSDMLSGDMALSAKNYGWLSTFSELSFSDSQHPQQIFNLYNDLIIQSSRVISNLESISRDAYLNKKYSEALFFRGVSLFYMSVYFSPGGPYDGNYSLKLDLNHGEISYYSTEDLVHMAIDDLNFSKVLMSISGGVRESKDQINKDVIDSYLAYAFASISDWGSVLNHTESVINSGYTILTETQATQSGFNDINELSTSVIWGKDIKEEDNVVGLFSFWGVIDIFSYSYAWAGDGKIMDRGLFAQIPADDVRKGQFYDAFGTSYDMVPYYKFYDGNRVVGQQRIITTDYIFMRVAEIYLLHAEASAKIGDEASAKTSLKALLDVRIPDSSYVDALSGQALLDEIYLQTRIEMWGEGKSYLAMKRNQATITRGTNWLDFAGDSFSFDDPRLSFNASKLDHINLTGFKTEWKIDSPSEITIYTNPDYDYNYFIDWGNGDSSDENTGNLSNYLQPGTYTITINGDFPHFMASGLNGEDAENGEKLTKIISVPENKFTDYSFSFANSSLQYLPELDVSEIESMKGMFMGADSFKSSRVSSWDVSSVKDMSSMFKDANSFSSDLSEWEFNSNVDLTDFISNTGISSFYYEKLLKKLNDLQITNKVLGAHNLKYSSEVDRNELIDEKNWTIIGDEKLSFDPNAFVLEISIEKDDYYVGISGLDEDSFFIDWGDGTTGVSESGSASHEYSEPGVYLAEIIGTFPSLNLDQRFTVVHNWGNNPWVDMSNMFGGSKLQTIKSSSSPNLSNTTNMNSMFSYARSFNGDLSTWDVSSVADMSFMFQGASSFNGELSAWDVSNVTGMNSMFSYARSFNGDFSEWQFNASNNGLDEFVSYSNLSTTNYEGLIQQLAIRNLNDMTLGARGVEYCDNTFRDYLIQTSNFRIIGDINSCSEIDASAFTTLWYTGELKLLTDSSLDYNYNVDWGDGNVSTGVTGDVSHNYDSIDNYEVKITGQFPYFKNFISGFDNEIIYSNSQLISILNWGNINWESFRDTFGGLNGLSINASDNPNLSEVNNLDNMFGGVNFYKEYDFGKWNISNVQSAVNFANYISVSSYDNLLKGWSDQDLKTDVAFSVGAYYCDESSRGILTDLFGWEITDLGLSSNCDSNLSVDNLLKQENYIYPNPTYSKMFLNYSNYKSFSVYDLNGRLIKSSNEKYLDMSDFSNQTYIIRVYDNNYNEIGIHKLIKK